MLASYFYIGFVLSQLNIHRTLQLDLKMYNITDCRPLSILSRDVKLLHDSYPLFWWSSLVLLIKNTLNIPNTCISVNREWRDDDEARDVYLSWWEKDQKILIKKKVIMIKKMKMKNSQVVFQFFWMPKAANIQPSLSVCWIKQSAQCSEQPEAEESLTL